MSGLYWQLDVGMQKNNCRIRRERASENMATIRHIAFNYLKSYTNFKAGTKCKKKQASQTQHTCLKSYQGWGLRQVCCILTIILFY